MADDTTPVLIVGAGPSGLSSALFLARHGVSCQLVERHPDLLIHPRARGLTPRTMEVYRQAGVEPAILAAAYAGPGFAWVPVRARTLNDEYSAPDEPQEDDGAGASPCSFGPIDQDKLEVVLRDAARRLGADIRFASELTSFEHDQDGVTAAIRDGGTGAQRTVRAGYLIAADGGASPIRQRLGIAMDGPGTLFSTITAMVDADLTPALRGRQATIAYLDRPQPYTILLAHDEEGRRWVFGTGYDAERESPEDFDDARVASLVRAAAGLPDVEVRLRPQIPGTEMKVLAFPIRAQLARAYRASRVFLVGDAAHSWPPTGGLGANTGIQDAHNLAWKLALVIRGQAGPALLDTYEQERRPVGAMTMGQAMARFSTRMGPADADPILPYSAVAAGYRYRSPAAPGAGQDDAPLPPTELTGQPGTRAPHVEVTHQGRRISTLDLYGSRFVLLAGPEGDRVAATARLSVPVDVYRFGADLQPAATAAHGIGTSGALLVRPDGFVAWRAESGPADPAALPVAMTSILGHDQERAAGQAGHRPRPDAGLYGGAEVPES